ncbi:MAG: flavodoxin-dependent (E)-4-hydroxy-3-methylbut-2-enyl-diphosphate synthase [Bacilli bacterium]|nr:flavodoxin-dependent (E)-4-hydroxy-3-methylbut-2-enyl-diphosphate synthase [Bacilli bacterium]
MRKPTRVIKIGSTFIGGDNPIAIQSMTNTPTKDVQKTLKQIEELQNAGCDIIRLAVLDVDDANALYEICKNTKANIVADIHFDYKLALIAIDAGVCKLRINPGNIGSIDGIKEIVTKCKEKHIPIRIGVNSGSINKDIEKKYGTGAKALVESAKTHIKILEDLGFYDIVVSIKASSVKKTIEAYTLFSKKYDYPLHLGVTEAGTNYSGSIKSAIAIGDLLLDGIGDTIRVSLTDDPVKEVYAAKEILSAIDLYEKPTLVSCPTCGRCQYDLFKVAGEIDNFLNTLKGNIKVAVMGCIVNGPGEAKDADLGIAGGKNCAMFFKKGEALYRMDEQDIINYLKNEIIIYLDKLEIKYFNEINDDIKNLREEIFVKEQGFMEEIDEYDENNKCTYVVLYKDNMPVATGRMYIEGINTYHLGRICVKKEYRYKRYGSIILMALEQKIEKGSRICLSSQNDALPFYEKNNYIKTDEEYYDEFCLHTKMYKEK